MKIIETFDAMFLFVVSGQVIKFFNFFKCLQGFAVVKVSAHDGDSLNASVEYLLDPGSFLFSACLGLSASFL